MKLLLLLVLGLTILCKCFGRKDMARAEDGRSPARVQMDTQIDSHIEQTRQILALRPQEPRAWLQLALLLQTKDIRNHNGGRLQGEALKAFSKALELADPSDVETIIRGNQNMGILLKMMGHGTEALNAYAKAESLTKNPRDLATIYYHRSDALVMLGRLDEALMYYKKSFGLDPRRIDTYLPIVSVYDELKTLNKTDWKSVLTEIETAYDNCESIDISDPDVIEEDIDEDEEYEDEVIPKTTRVIRTKSYLHDQEEMQCRRAISSGALWAMYRAAEKVGESSNAWKYLQKAHEAELLRRGTYEFNAEVAKTQADNVMKIFVDGFWPKGTGDERKFPIFIVGMMRSGSTLLETMLDAHSQIWGMGEDSVFNGNLQQFRDDLISVATAEVPNSHKYIAKMKTVTRKNANHVIEAMTRQAKSLSQSSGKSNDILHVVDKMLFNYRNLGFIHLMFPNAVILHSIRDPMDTLFSCYKHKFDDLGLDWSLKIEDLVVQYVIYLQLMNHFRQTLPGTIIDVRYEELVTNPTETLKPIVERIGVDWTDSMLSFHTSNRTVHTHSQSQVRQGLYTGSIGAWRKYAKELQPMIKLLRPKLQQLKKSNALPFADVMNWDLDKDFNYSAISIQRDSKYNNIMQNISATTTTAVSSDSARPATNSDINKVNKSKLSDSNKKFSNDIGSGSGVKKTVDSKTQSLKNSDHVDKELAKGKKSSGDVSAQKSTNKASIVNESKSSTSNKLHMHVSKNTPVAFSQSKERWMLKPGQVIRVNHDKTLFLKDNGKLQKLFEFGSVSTNNNTEQNEIESNNSINETPILQEVTKAVAEDEMVQPKTAIVETEIAATVSIEPEQAIISKEIKKSKQKATEAATNKLTRMRVKQLKKLFSLMSTFGVSPVTIAQARMQIFQDSKQIVSSIGDDESEKAIATQSINELEQLAATCMLLTHEKRNSDADSLFYHMFEALATDISQDINESWLRSPISRVKVNHQNVRSFIAIVTDMYHTATGGSGITKQLVKQLFVIVFNGWSSNLVNTGKIEDGLKLIDVFVSVAPEQLFAQFRKGELLMMLQNHEEAEKTFSILVGADVENIPQVEVLISRGTARFKLKKFRLAYEDFSFALNLLTKKRSINPHEKQREAQLWNLKGKTEKEFGQLIEANASHSRALALDPKLKDAYMDRAIVLMEYGTWEVALKDVKLLLQMEPNYKNAQGYTGLLFQSMGRTTEAIQAFNQALVADSSDKQCQFLKSVCYHALGNLTTALESYSRLLTLDPTHYAWYRRELAVYHLINRDVDISLYSQDVAVHSFVREGLSQKQSMRDNAQSYYSQYKKLSATDRKHYHNSDSDTSLNHNSDLITCFSNATSKNCHKICATKSDGKKLIDDISYIGNWIQLKTPGFLPNRRQHRMFSLGVLQMAQELRQHAQSLARGGPGLLVPDSTSSKVGYIGFKPSKSIGVRDDVSYHAFGWRDLFDIAVRWRAVSEPMDIVWWIDQLPEKKSWKERVGLSTFIVQGVNQVSRYYPYYNKSLAAVKDGLISGRAYDSREELIQLKSVEKDKVRDCKTVDEVFEVIKQPFFVVAPVHSNINDRILNGTRITISKSNDDGWDFSICSASTPERFIEFEQELNAAFNDYIDDLVLYMKQSDPRSSKLNLAAIRLFYLWVNYAPITRGSSATGYMALFASLLAMQGEFANEVPEGIQLDWEAMLSPHVDDFVAKVSPWMFETKETSLNKKYLDVSTWDINVARQTKCISQCSDMCSWKVGEVFRTFRAQSQAINWKDLDM